MEDRLGHAKALILSVLVCVELIGLALIDFRNKELCNRLNELDKSHGLATIEPLAVGRLDTNLNTIDSPVKVESNASSLVWVSLKRDQFGKAMATKVSERLKLELAVDQLGLKRPGVIIKWSDALETTSPAQDEQRDLCRKARVCTARPFLLLVDSPLCLPAREDQEGLNYTQELVVWMLDKSRKYFLEIYWLVSAGLRMCSNDQLNARHLLAIAHTNTQVVSLVVLDERVKTISLTIPGWGESNSAGVYALQRLVLYAPQARIEQVCVFGVIFVYALDVRVGHWKESLQELFITPRLTLGLQRIRLEIGLEVDKSEVYVDCVGYLSINVELEWLIAKRIEISESKNVANPPLTHLKIKSACPLIAHLGRIVGFNWKKLSDQQVWLGSSNCTEVFSVNMREWAEANRDFEKEHVVYARDWLKNRFELLLYYGNTIARKLDRLDRLDRPEKTIASLPEESIDSSSALAISLDPTTEVILCKLVLAMISETLSFNAKALAKAQSCLTIPSPLLNSTGVPGCGELHLTGLLNCMLHEVRTMKQSSTQRIEALQSINIIVNAVQLAQSLLSYLGRLAENNANRLDCNAMVREYQHILVELASNGETVCF
ncbi:hypothetical protein NEHOM01_2270 [Nematocida homosporus]|uniref:uncharacterized protein n=1 Tax=Nematocida homosporus TaxID=1912981 RepID=UPI002220CC71|nr:uncharacterized protein NEHOM01_1333 [Nematocida homosporus]XP_051347108.1 uncharacterized protein NEHOM01_2270 [Nematocida homosporus]KAI5186244.1 hypothetical protein NEHOM01_1333 [Nematocida homosporus]KAI5187558.1 hypothetical protein NEHOM01_2270 [Nematocida homosporus]